MKPQPDKPVIKQHIQTFFDMFRIGETFQSEDVVKFVKRRTGKQFYPDTILRYARELRQDGKVNYTCTCKMHRVIKVLGVGSPHAI